MTTHNFSSFEDSPARRKPNPHDVEDYEALAEMRDFPLSGKFDALTSCTALADGAWFHHIEIEIRGRIADLVFKSPQSSEVVHTLLNEPIMNFDHPRLAEVGELRRKEYRQEFIIQFNPQLESILGWGYSDIELIRADLDPES